MRRVMLVLIVAVSMTARGMAQPVPAPPSDDKLEADRLFEDGRTLLADGKRDEACAKFDLSFRKDPRAVGTMLNLAQCRETAGQVATALHLYGEARARAHDQDLHEHEAAADRRLALLAPRVPHLAILLPSDAPSTTRILVDDLVLARDQLADVVVDPGTRTVVVTAPDRLPFEVRVILAEGDHRTVTVPSLKRGTTLVIGNNPRRTLGKVLTAVGGGLVVTAGGLGLWARDRYWSQFPAASRDNLAARDEAHPCWTEVTNARVERACNTQGSANLATARTIAHVSTGVAITGGLALGAGLILWWTAGRHEPLARVSLDLGPGNASFTITRGF